MPFANIEERNTYAREWAREARKDPKYKKKEADNAKKWRDANPEHFRDLQKTSRENTRHDVLFHYSKGTMKCECCGEDILDFLTIDHINGDGKKHRKEINSTSSVSLYSWLRTNNYPSGFRVLCFNCNCGRTKNKGICPHKNNTS